MFSTMAAGGQSVTADGAVSLAITDICDMYDPGRNVRTSVEGCGGKIVRDQIFVQQFLFYEMILTVLGNQS